MLQAIIRAESVPAPVSERARRFDCAVPFFST